MEKPLNISRKSFLKLIACGGVATVGGVGCSQSKSVTKENRSSEDLFVCQNFTERGSFTSGVEGPAVDTSGNLYAVNYARQHTIGKVTPDGRASVFVELEKGSIGNGIRFSSNGNMLIADYTNHNVLKVEMETREVSVYAHQPKMNQPNDIAIGADDKVYASDPNWSKSTGQLWRIDTDGQTTLLERDMGTTNGIEVGIDEKTLYVGESVQRKVWAYDLSRAGKISNKRLLIEFPDHGLDGMRCDTAGNLYITRYGKGTVAVVTPKGEISREVTIAAGKNPSNLAFGGPDGRTVYVTVADVGNVQRFRTDTPGRSWKLLNDMN
ncbi:SMP-30/gluconolactonase/LRE family protein [Aliifodinibius sp. S!AR15-10]|uniref:SMP-30/gluconolactonase/LRE family protein n=1 Tax=Aliifodinibius sp. S!AR15-10 TaxID=2950437 RepID=UPI0028640F8B|nr:SMP-30/gluconolactonase/LRE family protein [Aliifodinibius sp. S!AR15-10]MDR8392139.1 SMP-30/gluconolactonase/LRE family protein [Aliifodinibius sp. S!AR15-10]